ncbi:MAG: DNA polymerase III subunit gamma/tau [Firmicutes bacterium]|nr:DNA polymerase III subunit gamma/tau [Bacillota bacterium]
MAGVRDFLIVKVGDTMGYTALYRKLRPSRFADVIGQEHIVKTLVNQIESGRVTHAYLFCGTRGTGKTSTAKIFAKAVNCMDLRDGEPCGECEVCRNINEGRNFNVVELDAASNNSVDDVRKIIDEVQYTPTEGNYKVYIIDEVHMLSASAFNALLKTLEEPPKSVIFILATTDPQKIPVTILSRCQRFDFRRITSNDIYNALKEYMTAEKVDIEDEALEYISSVADGGMRDALSILDQCISFFYGEKITLENVLELVGSVDKSVFFEFTDALDSLDSKKVMEIIDDIVLKGRDIGQFVSELILHLRNVTVLSAIGLDSAISDFTKETKEKYISQGNKIYKEKLIDYINRFSLLQTQIKYSSNPRILLEVCCIKICNPLSDDSNTIGSMMGKIAELEKKISIGVISSAVQQLSPIADTPQKIIKEKAVPDDVRNVIENWNKVAERFEAFNQGVLIKVSPRNLEDKFLYIVCNTKGHYDRVCDIKDDIENALEDIFEKKFDIMPIKKEDYDEKSLEHYGSKDDTIDDTEITKESFGSISDDITFE